MIYRIFLMSISIMLSLASCKEDPQDTGPVCNGDCLFVLKSVPGTMIKLNCFNRFAVKAQHPETNAFIYGIPDSLDAQFEDPGRSVIFSGRFRANTLVPDVYDPDFSPQSIFQMEIISIQ